MMTNLKGRLCQLSPGDRWLVENLKQCNKIKMEPLGNTEAYREGLKSVAYKNPYPINSDEYNDFERGWSQRVKSGFRCNSTIKNKKPSTFQEKYKNWK